MFLCRFAFGFCASCLAPSTRPRAQSNTATTETPSLLYCFSKPAPPRATVPFSILSLLSDFDFLPPCPFVCPSSCFRASHTPGKDAADDALLSLLYTDFLSSPSFALLLLVSLSPALPPLTPSQPSSSLLPSNQRCTLLSNHSTPLLHAPLSDRPTLYCLRHRCSLSSSQSSHTNHFARFQSSLCSMISVDVDRACQHYCSRVSPSSWLSSFLSCLRSVASRFLTAIRREICV